MSQSLGVARAAITYRPVINWCHLTGRDIGRKGERGHRAMDDARRPRVRVRVLLGALIVVMSQLTACGLVRNPPPKSAPPSQPTPDGASTPSPSQSPTILPTASSASSTSRDGHKSPGCRNRENPRAGVFTPIRLTVRAACITVHGTVGCITTDQRDGDTHLAMLLDPGQTKYLTPGNLAWACTSDQESDTAPRMVVEVIPQHCTVRPDNCADLGHFTDPQIPGNGQHVTITGAWVQDTSHFHGETLWSEIHPAWKITVDS